MGNWDKISLFKFQQIELISNKPGMSELDITLFSTCIVFGFTEFELDNLPLKKVTRLTAKMQKIFETPFTPVPQKRIGKYWINYDISKMTFGQYVELSYFLNNPLQFVHYIMASISNKLFRRNKSKDHRQKAEYFLKMPVSKITGSLTLLMETFSVFNKEYKSLFGLDKEVTGDVQSDPFNKRYGWIYSVEQIAAYERITNEQAFALPVRQAFNDLAYLKAKAKYEAEQLKQNSNAR